MENLGGALFFIAMFAWLAFSQWLESRKSEERRRMEIEAQKLRFEANKLEFEGQKLLLDKCQSTEEVNKFLSTDAGKKFLERMSGTRVAPPVYVNPMGGIMALIVFGTLGLGLGVAFYLLSRFTSHSGMIIPAFLLSVPGVGLLIGAAVSYHLKKKWGLLKRDPSAPVV